MDDAGRRRRQRRRARRHARRARSRRGSPLQPVVRRGRQRRGSAGQRVPRRLPSSGESWRSRSRSRRLESHRSSSRPAAARRRGLDGAHPRSRRRSRRLDERLEFARDAGASDLHVVPGRPMLLRLAGELVPRGGVISEDDGGADASRRSSRSGCGPALEEQRLVRLRARPRRRTAASASTSRGSGRGLKACFRCIPPAIPTLASLGLPPEIEKRDAPPPGPRPRHRAHRPRQDEHARGDRRHHQPRDDAPHHHRRGPGRVRPPAQEGDDEPARGRHEHAVVRERRSRRRSARIRTSSSSASCATPRRCAWRSPRARPATSCSGR